MHRVRKGEGLMRLVSTGDVAVHRGKDLLSHSELSPTQVFATKLSPVLHMCVTLAQLYLCICRKSGSVFGSQKTTTRAGADDLLHRGDRMPGIPDEVPRSLDNCRTRM